MRVAHCLIDLLLSTSMISVAVEAFAPTDDIVIRDASAPTRYEQIKERAPRGGHWTAAAIVDEGIAEQFLRQYAANSTGIVVLFSASSASEFREIAERARHARANHPLDDTGIAPSEREWELRLNGAMREYVVDLIRRQKVAFPNGELTQTQIFAMLTRVVVLDAQGTIDRRRQAEVERLAPLVDDPRLGLEILERLARRGTTTRHVITRREVETALQSGGAGPRTDRFAVAVDPLAYALDLEAAVTANDVARLPALTPTFDRDQGTAFDLNDIRGKTVLMAGHGAGKSRLVAHAAIAALQSGRRCLHVRLARWVDTLVDLLVSELSRVAMRSATDRDLEEHLGSAGAIVMDGLDEVPATDRLRAERSIAQFGDRHPHLSLLIATRPGSGRELAERWRLVKLAPLTAEQIETALGEPLHRLGLSAAIETLAANPLMLGLLKRAIASGGQPDSESRLLEQFIGETLDRQSTRDPAIDALSGRRVAEEIAFAWLSTGRVAIDLRTLRELTAAAARRLRTAAMLESSAPSIERWLMESGLIVNLGSSITPVHRAILDHLAGAAVVRHEAVDVAGRPELREAVARFAGSQSTVTEELLSVLTALGADLELLARAKRLIPQHVEWPFSPERFATEYLAALRRITSGPLADIGVVGQPICVELDRALTWVRETAGSQADSIAIVDTPNRVSISVGGPDSMPIPVERFHFGGHRGARISVKVPHLIALERVEEELRELVKNQSLPREGPDIVYERLCLSAARLIRTMTLAGPSQYRGMSHNHFNGLTAVGFETMFVGLAADVPQLGAHGAHVATLMLAAREFGIEGLPLHPLGLRPESSTDEVLLLPGDWHALRGDSLSKWVVRHELAEMRAFRYLVEHNLAGLSPFLLEYGTLPWRVELVVEDHSTPTTFDAAVGYVTRRHASHDEAVIVSEFAEADRLYAGSSLIRPPYRTVTRESYALVQHDLEELLRAAEPLGLDAL